MTNDLTPDNLQNSPEASTGPLFSGAQVSTAAFLGGPFGGGWLLFKNFTAIGDKAREKSVVLASFALTFAVAVLAMWLPTDASSALIPAVTVAIFTFWYQYRFKSILEAHIENGGAKASWWKAIGLSIVSAVATFALIFILVIVLPILPANHIKDDDNIIYYEGDATKDDAQSLARFLRDTGVFNSNASWELTLEYPKRDSQRVVIKLSYGFDIKGTRAEDEVRSLAALIDEEKYRARDVEIHIQNAFGVTTQIVRAD